MDDLQGELMAAVLKTRKNARWNYWAAYITVAVTVTASIGATVLVGIDDTPQALTAILASIPAALLAISTTFKFEQKSAWHWKKNKRLEGLLRALKYENASSTEVSKKFSMVEEEMDQEWITFGAVGKGNDSGRIV